MVNKGRDENGGAYEKAQKGREEEKWGPKMTGENGGCWGCFYMCKRIYCGSTTKSRARLICLR